METERKYQLDEQTVLPSWSGVKGVADTVGPTEHVLEATYFDTPGLRLAAAGVTLRRRRGGSDSGWHLKLPVAAGTREEIRVGFARGEGRRRNPQPPQELLDLVRALTRDEPVEQVAELSTVRRMWRLADGQGRDLVEIVDDHVTGTTMGAATETVTWREVEIELADRGDTDLLDRLERRLTKTGIDRSDAPSKLARLLGARLPRRPKPPGRRSTVGEVVLAYLRDQYDALRALDPAVRRAHPDAVHQMRVATRRMRATLQAYRTVIPRDATRELGRELGWLASVLGVARDLEVLEDRLHHQLAALPDDLVLGPVQAQLTRHFAGRRAQAHDELVAALDGERYLDLLNAVDQLVSDPPLTARAAKPARQRLNALISQAFAPVDDHLAQAARLPTGEERDTALHEARKAAKRLRYAAEAATPVLGKRARQVVARVKDVQELLGDHQDAAVSRTVLRELGATAPSEGGNGFTFGLLYGHAATTSPDAALRPSEKRLRAAVKKLA